MRRLWICFTFVAVLLRTPKCSALVEVNTPIDTYWGNDGDAELRITANVTSSNGWDDITVMVTAPDNREFTAVTDDDSDNASWKIYTHTIKSLFVADAGSYNLTVQDGDSEDNEDTDSATITIYIFTIDVLYTTAHYYAVERTEQLTVAINLKTDGNWDNVDVAVESPNGETLPTNHSPTEVPFWRMYTATIEDIAQGTFVFIANETLGGKVKTISSAAIVEVSETTAVDEYLYRIDKISPSITSQIPNFYSYLYDGTENTHIRDGGKDMYDQGNYITVSANTSTTPNAPYGKPYSFENYMFSSIATYPFTTLMWISNDEAVEDVFSLKVTGHTGATGDIYTVQYKSQFAMSSYSVNYQVVQLFGVATDPTICEVYFHITNEEDWSSVAPDSVDFDVAGALPNSLDNMYTVHGATKNIMMGYMLLSRNGGDQIQESDIVTVLENITAVIEVKDEFTLTSEGKVKVDRSQSAITLTAQVTSSGNWEDIAVVIVTPAGSTSTLDTYNENGEEREYLYPLDALSEEDTGVYTFTATDAYNYEHKSTTLLTVLLAEIHAPSLEYWGANGDEELILSVIVMANEWTGTKVMVTRPDGEVHEANPETLDPDRRTYTHRVTNLFSEDAGEYVFITEMNGIATSDPVKVTVYLFTVSISPDAFHSHAIEKEDKAQLMVYVACDGDWANVEGMVTAPNGKKFPMTSVAGSITPLRIFYANVTGVTGGEYNITVTETLGTRSESKSSKHTIEIQNSTQVDEYLYRFGLISDDLVSYVDKWQTYWYDCPDYTCISDGGFDMYDRGNYISLFWSSGEELNIPYGKPFQNNVINYSSKNFYPFVSLLWIDNQNRTEEEFSMMVSGKSGMAPNGKHETFKRALFEGAYDVTYHVFQTFDSTDPSICEVYFLITNTYEWNSVLPDTFNFNITGAPPQVLQNIATVTGSPSKIMLGYTLLSKESGEKADFLEIEKVVERYVDVIAERDQFGIKPTNEDGMYASIAGKNATVEAVVSTSGKWDGIGVEVILPSGARKDVLEYKLSNLHTQRIYQYIIPNVQYSDNGDYNFIATDRFEEREETISKLYVFTLKTFATTTQYAGGEDSTIVMEVFATTESDTSVLSAEIDTPTLGTLPITSWTNGENDIRAYQHTIDSPTYERDNGNYTFRVTERIDDKHGYSTTVGIDLAVFSVSTSVDEDTYVVNVGQEILAIEVEVSTLGDWDAIEVVVETPRKGTKEVNEYDQISDTKRNYIHEMRNVGSDDAGNYGFVASETLYGETYSRTDSITVEVKVSEEKLSGGEIAGIVIGSVAGVALLGGLIWHFSRNKSSPSSKAPSKSAYLDEKVLDLEEKQENTEVFDQNPEKTEVSNEKTEENSEATAL